MISANLTAQTDSLVVSGDTLFTQPNDTIPNDSIPTKSNVKTTIDYSAEDSIRYNVLEQKVYLYGDAQVIYGNTTLEAEYIEIDQRTNKVTAQGRPDSTGKLQGIPVFTQDGDQYVAKEIIYDTETQKGIIRDIVTEQGQGYIQGEKVKKQPDNTMYLRNGLYTTCNLAEPHFHIKASKIKLVPEKSIITGPFNLYIDNAPTPLGFLFGLFPFSSTRKSGIIVPEYGESADLGFFLRNGGYYWAIGDKVGLTFLGELYTNGSWGVSLNGVYKKRYNYGGNFSLRYNNRFRGEDEDRSSTREFWVTWAHAPVPRGNGTLSANVNFGTTQFNQNFAFEQDNFLANNFASSVSYSRTFGSWGNMTVNLRQDQNTRTGIVNATIPEVNFAVNRFFPFKKKGKTGRGWVQQINLAYSVSSSNRLTNTPLNTSNFPFAVANGVVEQDTLDFYNDFGTILQRSDFGIVHNIPLSTTVKLFKYISLNPSISYQEFWYPRQLSYAWDPDSMAVRVDTLNQFSRAFNTSMSANLTTRIYGTFLFPNSEKIEGIRHVIIPTVGFSYTPDLSFPQYGFYQEVQTDSLGNRQKLSRFQGFSSGGPGGTEAGNLNFSINNTFEMKKRPINDSTQAEKVPLMENLTFGGSYNFLADSLKLSNISISANTRFLKDFITINATANLNPYVTVLDSTDDNGTIFQRRVNRLAITNGQGLGQITNVSFRAEASFTPAAFRELKRKKNEEIRERQEEDPRLQGVLNDPNRYVDFEIPWSLRVNYLLNWSRDGFRPPQQTQTLNFSGDLSITKTWKIGFSSGYDFDARDISFTSIDIYKDLHCWEMRFNWIPFGARQSYTFDINVKASILQDLKLSRRRSWYDR